MTENDSRHRQVASLTDLLAEHTRVAEQERQEIESRLREKEEDERRRREDEERRQKELLQQRLEEEKRRAQDRFQRQQGREAQAEVAPAPAAPAAVVAVAPPAKSHTLLAVAATVVLMAGAAVGAYFLFFTDTAPARRVMRHQGSAVVAEVARQADVLAATHAANEGAEKQAQTIASLQQQLATASADIERLKSEMSDAQKAAAEARKQMEETAQAAAEAAKGNGGNGRKTVRREGTTPPGGISVRKGIFDGKTIVE